MNDQQKKLVMLGIIVVVALIALGISLISTFSGGETVTKFSAVPPKGISKHERD